MILLFFFLRIIKTCCFFFWEKVSGFSEQSNWHISAVVGVFETPTCYHSNDRYLTFNPINVMCYRCILSTPNLNFILVTKTPMNGNNSQPTKLSSASLRLRFSLTRKSRNHHHTRWCSARKLHIPWPWCVWSVCCSLWMTKHRGCYFFYSLV